MRGKSECCGSDQHMFTCIPEGVKSCANCVNYSWTQPDDGSSLLRCAKCKFISYCSKECQKERWVKVHKHHCKYLAELKVMPQSRHDPAICPGCIDQADIGHLELAKFVFDNSYMGCYLGR